MKKTKANLEQLKQQLYNPPSKRRDLKIMWQANAPWANSGYSVFSRDLCFRLLKDGWNVVFSGAGAGVDAYPIEVHGEDLIDDRFKGLKLKVYPRMGDPYGSDALIAHGMASKANVIFNMQDVWVLNPQQLSKIKTFIPYCPVDRYPVSQNVIANLQYAYKIITFSRFGQKALDEKGFTSTLIVEGTDTEMFKPMDKTEIRKNYGIPQDAFLFGMIAANKENPPRKGFQEAMEAFKLFHDKHPEAAMFFHSQQQTPGGFPIRQLSRELGVGDRCFFYDDYLSQFGSRSHQVVEQINMFDVLMHPSQTEGFGLTIIEAGACGIPVLVNNTTSMPELVIPGVTGEICKTDRHRFTPDNSWVWTADVNDLYKCMERLYARLHQPNTIAEDCRKHIVENYNIDTLTKTAWIPLMENLQEELLPPTLTKPVEEDKIELPATV